MAGNHQEHPDWKLTSVNPGFTILQDENGGGHLEDICSTAETILGRR
jgi:hypothetical protein